LPRLYSERPHKQQATMAGRGRGRGRGPAILPFTDEETGKRVSLDVDAPPKLFPVSPKFLLCILAAQLTAGIKLPIHGTAG